MAESGAELSSALLLSGPKNSRDEQDWNSNECSYSHGSALGAALHSHRLWFLKQGVGSGRAVWGELHQFCGTTGPPLCTSCGFHLSELPLYKQKKGPKLPHTCNTSNSNTFPFSPLLLNSLIFKNTTNTSKKWIILRYGVKWVLCVANYTGHITCPSVNLFVSVCQLHDETKTVTA